MAVDVDHLLGRQRVGGPHVAGSARHLPERGARPGCVGMRHQPGLRIERGQECFELGKCRGASAVGPQVDAEIDAWSGKTRSSRVTRREIDGTAVPVDRSGTLEDAALGVRASPMTAPFGLLAAREHSRRLSCPTRSTDTTCTT